MGVTNAMPISSTEHWKTDTCRALTTGCPVWRPMKARGCVVLGDPERKLLVVWTPRASTTQRSSQWFAPRGFRRIPSRQPPAMAPQRIAALQPSGEVMTLEVTPEMTGWELKQQVKERQANWDELTRKTTNSSPMTRRSWTPGLLQMLL